MDSSPPASRPESQPTGRWEQFAWRALALPLLLFLAVPVALLFTRVSPDQWWEALRHPQVYQAITVSLKTTLISLVVIIFFGTPLAYLMGRQRFRFKQVVDTLIDLPTMLPPSVAGVALLVTLGRRGVLGAWLEPLGVQIAFTQAAVVIAQVFIAAPFYVRAASLGFASIDPETEQAAELDGASRWEVFRYIVLPLSRNALLSGSMMSWSRALGEFGATILFAGNFPGRTQTMPIAIYLGFEGDFNNALTLSVILVSISFLSILLVKTLAGSDPSR